MKQILIILLISLISAALTAQQRVYLTEKITGTPPTIDGVINEDVWEQVEWEGNFIQWEPYEGKSPSQPTFFKVLYDDNNLYVGIMAYDSLPEEIDKRKSRRDGFEGDLVGIHIDSQFDKMTAYAFVVSAAGVKSDVLMSNDGDNIDETWNPIWYTKTSLNDSGWIAEIRIPFTQLRFGKKEVHTWGFQCVRKLFRKDELSIWQFISKEDNAWTSKFGELQGIQGIKPKRQIDLIPYVLAQQEYFEEEEGNPYATGKKGKINGGLDGKIGVTNDLMLDFTINPDFGQVEADPSEVNLTAFETFFEEKRPFFIEGNNIYNFQLTGGGNPFSSDNLFYSRRIGRRPHYYPDLDDNEYADVPENTSILGAFKLSGKTKKGWSVGIMESVTQREMAEISHEGKTREEEVEPFTNYFAARLEKDINKGNTVLGGMFTSTNRKIDNPSIDFIPKNAYTGGLNFKHFWKDKSWMVGLKTVFSSVNGDSISMTNLQESPVRYFQRPDANYLKLDSSRTSLQGQGGTLQLGKVGGGHWRFTTWVTWRSPGLELNDVGYLRSADAVQQVIWVSYRIWEPFSIFRSMNINFNQWSGWDFGGRNTFGGGNVNLNTQFKNHWFFGGGINFDTPSLSRSDLRGGPSLKLPGGWNFWISMDSDPRKKFSAEANYSQYKAFNNTAIFRNYGLELIYRPSNMIKLSLEPFYAKNNYKLQYVETTEYSYEDRYITAHIYQETFGLVGRIDLSITPDLTIQYYGQPFMSSGNYSKFNRITDSQADDYYDRYHVFSDEEISYNSDDEMYSVDENMDGSVDYTFENPNFNFLQFRSNLVFRWEYIPGSALYLVWSQGRTDATSDGDFNFSNNWNDLFDIYPHNVFLIKLSYRLAL